MVNRPLIVGAIGAAIVGAAIALTTYFEFHPEARPQGGAPASAPADVARSGPPTPVPPASIPEPASTREPAPADSAAKLAAPAISQKPIRPSFDIVRVNPKGDAVIAGRAAPNAEVTVTDGTDEIGKVKADSRGEWVLVPSKSLPSGPHELSLETKGKKDKPKVLSKRKVILVVPERGKDIAGRKTKKPSGSLVMAVPRDETGPTTVLQKPETPLRPRAMPAKPEVVARQSNLEPNLGPNPGPKPDPGRSAEPKSSTGAAAPAVVAETAGEAKPTVTAGETKPAVTPGASRDDQAVALNKLAPAAGSGRPRGLLGVPQHTGEPVQMAAREPGDDPSASVLSLDAIDYDESGNLSMSGQAPEDTNVRVYLDNRPIGGATTGEAGVWRLAPEISVRPGLYRMRVDQVDRSGIVVARIETPFSRAGPLGDLPRGAVTFVQPGNSLWRIARRTLGQGVRYTVIFEANRDQIRNPDLIYPGQIFVVPKVN